MTIMATASEGWQYIGFGAVLLACCAGPGMLAWWAVHGGRVAAIGGALGVAAAAVLCVVSGAPGFLALVAAAGAAAVIARRSLPRAGRIAASAAIVLAGVPLYFAAFFVIVIGIAAFGCAPDAYECPL